MFEKIQTGMIYKVQPPEDLYDLVGEFVRQQADIRGKALGYDAPVDDDVLVSVSYSYDSIHWTREVLIVLPDPCNDRVTFEYDYFEGQRYICIHWIRTLDEIDKKIGGK